MPLLYETIVRPRLLQKKATEIRCYLWDETGKTTRMENKTVALGTKILIRTALFQEPWYTTLDGKRQLILHRLNTGSWETILDQTATYNFLEKLYTLDKKGTHTFISQFPGDAEFNASQSTEAKIGVEVGVAVFPKEYLIGGALAVAGLLFVGLALRRRK